MTQTRFAAYSLLFGALVVGACSTEKVGDGDRECSPGASRDCTCDDGEEGTQSCNVSGSGYNACDCDPEGTGGASGSGGEASGGAGSGGESSGGAGTGGAATGGAGTGGAGTGGSAADAGDASTDGPDADTPDAMPDGGSMCLTTLDDGGALDPCNECLAIECCQEGLDCNAVGEPCSEEGDAGFSQLECVDTCLLQIAGADGGVLDDGALQECSELCAADGEDNVSDATFLFAGCALLFCEDECY